MNWKLIADHVLKLKNLANNEEIKDKLESLSLYNCWLKQILDGTDAGPEIQTSINKENELRNNTLAKIYELQKETEQAKTPEEEASKVIECFLYIDNYLSLYSEPELFFVQSGSKLQLCDSGELLNSKKKFDDIIQSMFFFQELNTRAHISIQALCSFLRESKTNITEFIDSLDYVIDRLDFVNRAVLDERNIDESLTHLYPFILIVNFTAQKLMIHRFTGNYPDNVNKKTFQEILKQKEFVLDRIKGKIIKKAEAIKTLKDKITEPMNQEILFDARCVEIYDEAILAKREEPEEKDKTASLIVTTDKINRCCTVAYWISFLLSNYKAPAAGDRNVEADEWLSLYLAVSKNDNYEIRNYSLRNFLLKNKIETVSSFSNIKIKPVKKEKGRSSMTKVLPIWLVLLIAVILAAAFAFFITNGTKYLVF